jgi:hypothetical protein
MVLKGLIRLSGMYINAQDDDGCTELWLAVKVGKRGAATWLVLLGVDIEIKFERER